MLTKEERQLSESFLSLSDLEFTYRTPSGDRVSPANEYIWEVSKYLIFKQENRIELISSEFIKSKKMINFKDKILGNKKSPILEYITVSLIGAPKKYIDNLPTYKLQKKLKLCQKKKK